jgi:TRAP-type C4-dicarboxylate transport system substrate-binding protein
MSTISRRVFAASAVATAALMSSFGAQAAEFTFRFHQQLPPQANVPKFAIVPWIQKVEKESGGRIKIQHFPAMQLGGKPPESFDQAKNGFVDFTWTVLGYTPGRFPKTEVFELPFMLTTNAENGSKAVMEFVQKNAMEEFKDVKLVAVHVHGAGMFHTKTPITRLEDLKGLKVRGASRVINDMLQNLGAVPVGMPVPAVGEALSKGVISGALVPYEIVPTLKLHQLVKNHTSFADGSALYTATFGVVMNKASYDKLPADLKKVIDNNSGIEAAALFGRAMDKGDVMGKELIKKAGNNFVTLDAASASPFKRQGNATREQWVADAKKNGIDGAKLLKEAEDLMAKYSK